MKDMAFSNEIVLQAWLRAGARCECCRVTCDGHVLRCNKPLGWSDRGNDRAVGGWEAHHKTAVAAGGSDALSNCEILCIACHKNTGTYGR